MEAWQTCYRFVSFDESPAMKFSYFFFFFLSVGSTLFSGCIQAPRIESASVLPNDEVQAVSLLKKGESFASSARFVQAEKAFRDAAQLYPGRANVFNNLGYVLLAQDRMREAREVLEQAIALEPSNLRARLNLAYVLYKEENFAEAIKQFQLALVSFVNPETSYEKHEFSQNDLSLLYRNLSMAYYLLGYSDEAVCHSTIAVGLAPTSAELGRHVRLLLLQERLSHVQALLSHYFSQNPDVPPRTFLLLDYAIAKYAAGDFSQAEHVFKRVLARNETRSQDKLVAYLGAYLLGLKSFQAQPSAQQSLLEVVDACELMARDYWPIAFREDINQLLSNVCDEQEEDSLNG